MFKLAVSDGEVLQRYTLSLFRVVVGFLFFCHGAASLFGVMGGAHNTGGALEPGTWPGWYAAVIQFSGGGMVALGAMTRIMALVNSGSMAYAYFSVHHPQALWPLENGGELAALFCWSFLLLAIAGPGPMAVDALISSRHSRKYQQ
ncbi:DoxX family protein [Streptomyces lavendulocolor]|uniref:DoxX family protein n=1 Tax=Streptomyces lavendulocolor TaxID=67316 RepID=UPI0033FF3F73